VRSDYPSWFGRRRELRETIHPIRKDVFARMYGIRLTGTCLSDDR
jgi:hypothetical protein